MCLLQVPFENVAAIINFQIQYTSAAVGNQDSSHPQCFESFTGHSSSSYACENSCRSVCLGTITVATARRIGVGSFMYGYSAFGFGALILCAECNVKSEWAGNSDGQSAPSCPNGPVKAWHMVVTHGQPSHRYVVAEMMTYLGMNIMLNFFGRVYYCLMAVPSFSRSYGLGRTSGTSSTATRLWHSP